MADRQTLAVWACVALSMLWNAGCAFPGPAALRGSRSAYNDAIIATNAQQVLSMLVRMRYGEPTALLAVSSITANMAVQANAGSEIGIGSETGYQGNLVPLSAGFAYESNPTISYTPVQGEQYMRQLLAPLPLDLTVLLLQALRHSPQTATLLLRSINGIRNPDFLADPSLEADPRFTRAVDLLAELARQGRASWTEDPEREKSFVLTLTGEGASFAAEVAELYGLLGLAAPRGLDAVVTLPLRSGVGPSGERTVRLETRSLFDLFNLAAASVEVPEEHAAAGIALDFPPAGPAGRNIRIRRSKICPGDAVAAARHHGWCFFIEASDTTSKQTFRIVESLLAVRIADAATHGRAAPLLTVPVSR